jgi:large subunit ribosomal protein L17
MRHGKHGRQLGRNSAHRKAMYRNMVTSLLEHERITTTLHKAKELRRYTERTITIGVRLGDLLGKEERDRAEAARVHAAMREAGKMVRTQEILHKLFGDIAIRYREGGGGYTRIVKLGRRVGDAAEMAIIELTKRAESEPEAVAAEA